jgi:hypothetical protein
MSTPTNDGHTTWCTGGHHCNLGEHRAQPVTITHKTNGGIVLTRVRHHTREYAEIRVSVRLHPTEHLARWQLTFALNSLETLLVRVGLPVSTTVSGVPAIGGRRP